MREVELSLNGTLREIFSFGESRGAFDRFLPSMCVMAEAQRYRPFGHRLSDELSEIILDYLHFDHRLTTTVQRNCKTPKKPVVTTDNGLFLVLVVTVQNQQILRFNVSLYCPVVVFRPGRPEVRIPSGAPRAVPYGVLLLLLCADFMGQ